MKNLIATLVVLSAVLATAESDLTTKKFDKLATLGGKQYEGVTVTAKRPDGISIVHESGTARIPFEDLPEDVKEKLGGFDEGKAKEARKKQAEKDNQNLRALNIAKEQKQLLKDSNKGAVRVFQSLEDGALCHIAWIGDQYRNSPGLASGLGTSTKYRGLGEFSDSLVFVPGLTGLVDGARVAGSFIKMPEPYVYTSTLGARQTISVYKLVARHNAKELLDE